MRAVVIFSLLALFCPAIAAAQSPPAGAPTTQGAATTGPGTAPAPKKGGGDITRDAFIERAKNSAGKRFDQMDANHDGVLSAAERRAARNQRRSSTPQ